MENIKKHSKVLIIGGGQVGAFSAATLREKGATVIVADSNPSIGYLMRYGSKVTCREIDILKPAKLKSLIKEVQPDTLLLSAGISAKAAKENPLLMKKISKNGTRNVMQSAIECGVNKFIFLSSFAVYGKTAFSRDGISMPEDAELNPESNYAESKIMAEDEIMTFSENGIKIRILRSSGTYGPIQINQGSRSAAFFEALLLFAVNKKKLKLKVHPSGDEYIYIKDLAKIITIISMEQKNKNVCEILNAGSGVITIPAEISKLLKAKFPGNGIELIPLEASQNQKRSPLNISKLISLYGFTLDYSLSKGINDYLQISNFII